MSELEFEANVKLYSIFFAGTLNYDAAVELMSSPEAKYNNMSCSVGGIWCQQYGRQFSNGNDRETLQEVVSHNHPDTKVETMTGWMASRRYGSDLVERFNIGSKNVVSSTGQWSPSGTSLEIGG